MKVGSTVCGWGEGVLLATGFRYFHVDLINEKHNTMGDFNGRERSVVTRERERESARTPERAPRKNQSWLEADKWLDVS